MPIGPAFASFARFLPKLCLFGVTAFLVIKAPAQDNPLFLKIRTDVTVDIREHSSGANLVEIRMRDPHYPVPLLKSQVEKICSMIGTPARGLNVGDETLAGDAAFSYVTATFATNGIVGQDGSLDIEPFLKGFAGVPAPYTISGLTIDFEGIAPTSQTVQRYGKPGIVEAEGRYTKAGVLKGIEYRIGLLTQDPNKISFPERYQPSLPAQAPKHESPSGNAYMLMLGFLGAGIIVGALVYFAMLRTGKTAHS